MMILDFEAGLVLTLRTSGTEPKIKFYSEMNGAVSEKSATEKRLAGMLEEILDDLLQPNANGLGSRS